MKTTTRPAKPGAHDALAEAAAAALAVQAALQRARARLAADAPRIVMNAIARVERAQAALLEEIEAAEVYIEESGLA